MGACTVYKVRVEIYYYAILTLGEQNARIYTACLPLEQSIVARKQIQVQLKIYHLIA